MEESNVFYRPFFVGGSSLFENGFIKNDFMSFIDASGNLELGNIESDVSLNILDGGDIIITSYLPANLEIINNTLLDENNKINISFFSANLQTVETDLIEPVGTLNTKYYTPNMNIMNNLFVTLNGNVNDSFLPANIQIINDDIFENSNKVKTSFFSSNIQNIENVIIGNEVNPNYLPPVLKLMNSSFYLSDGTINPSFYPSNLEYLHHNGLTIDEYDTTLNLALIQHNSGFFTVPLNASNNYFVYVESDGTFANVGEYNVNTLVFIEFGNVLFDTFTEGPFGVVGLEHRVNVQYSYVLTNNKENAYLIDYNQSVGTNNYLTPKYRYLSRDTWPPV